MTFICGFGESLYRKNKSLGVKTTIISAMHSSLMSCVCAMGFINLTYFVCRFYGFCFAQTMLLMVFRACSTVILPI